MDPGVTTVGGVPYTWSDNGNLLGDGTYTYAYDHAGRLISATWGTRTHTFAYNGLGDRLRQAVDGTPTTYSLDLVGGLTQVLSAGGTAYLYGTGRIGEEQPGSWQYHLGDALGSLRQLGNASADITLARTYEPFGDPLITTGAGSSIYGFTGEQRDGTGLVYLRARYYSSYLNQWIQPDPIVPDPTTPAELNRYTYVQNNPVNLVDPRGEYSENVHRGLTAELADGVNRSGGCRVAACHLLPSLISRGNQRMDEWIPHTADPRLVPMPLFGGQYHFATRTEARADAAAAIELANPSLFGAALHEIQDSYSHWGEGYRMPLGHLSHTWIAASRVTLQSRGAHQGASLLSQFYQEHPEN